ncbi:hypothetical protein LTR22_004079 [Elasticomyces elasticus]|nr:hypothetical protein LTR22_004079 [Elasticomyces elasticus]
MGLLGSSNAKLKEDGARYGDGRDDYAAGDDTAEDTIWGRRLLDTSKSFDNLENVHRDLSLKIEEVISYEQKRMDLLIHSPARKGPPSTIFPFGPASAIPAWTPTAASGVWQSVRPPIEHAVSAADATAAWAAYTATASRSVHHHRLTRGSPRVSHHAGTQGRERAALRSPLSRSATLMQIAVPYGPPLLRFSRVLPFLCSTR